MNILSLHTVEFYAAAHCQPVIMGYSYETSQQTYKQLLLRGAASCIGCFGRV